MSKVKVIVKENFASRGERYAKGQMVSMSKQQADRFIKEGLVRDAIEALGIELPQVDLSKYILITEHDKKLKNEVSKTKALEEETEKLKAQIQSQKEKIEELEQSKEGAKA